MWIVLLLLGHRAGCVGRVYWGAGGGGGLCQWVWVGGFNRCEGEVARALFYVLFPLGHRSREGRLRGVRVVGEKR